MQKLVPVGDRRQPEDGEYSLCGEVTFMLGLALCGFVPPVSGKLSPLLNQQRPARHIGGGQEKDRGTEAVQ